MKIIIAILMLVSLVGCTTAQLGKIDTAVKATAPQVCAAAEAAYQGFTAVGLGSTKLKAQVEVAYNAAKSICADPSRASAVQLAFVTAKTGLILYNMQKVKNDG